MTPPPRDRWIVVWVDDSSSGLAAGSPYLMKWEEQYDQFEGSTMWGEAYWAMEREIAAWAECPARPHEP